MKNYLLFFLGFLPLESYAQWDKKGQFGLYGTAEIPHQRSMPYMSTNYGLGMQLSYKPSNRLPVFLELKGSLGQYSSEKSNVNYLFSDGSSTFTDVSYKSNMNRIILGAKTYFSPYDRVVRGYITPQIGGNFMKSKIRIADPDDIDDCQPLDNRVVHKSSDWTFGGELGLEIDLHELFVKRQVPQSRFYISTSFIGSFRSMDYINIKYMQNDVHGVHDHSDHSHLDAAGRPLTASFINVTNGSTHEHKIAEIYRTPLRLFTINIGYVWYF